MSVPSICSWLLMFYLFFHVWLNIIAELTYFGDRNFYEDWWTSRDVEMFWRKWNKPVHNFLKTQVYVPLAFRFGVNKMVAMVLVFFLSAVAHEVVVSVPLRTTFNVLQLHSLWGMMFQVPLVYMTKRCPPWLGNSFFWVSIMIGQPCGVFFYYHDFILKHGQPVAAAALIAPDNSFMSALDMSMTVEAIVECRERLIVCY